MRERFFIVGALGLLVIALVGLNTASYVQKEKIPDSEVMPHRSTFNTGPTGTRAFHDLLVSTGQIVKRWERPITELKTAGASDIATFVIVGATRREITDVEVYQLLAWVDGGGFLVIIDRDPLPEILKTTGSWTVETSKRLNGLSDREIEMLLTTVDPANAKQMTDGEDAAKPLQPTPATLNVNAVQPSKFAASVQIRKATELNKKVVRRNAPTVLTAPEPTIVPKSPAGERRKEVYTEGPAANDTRGNENSGVGSVPVDKTQTGGISPAVEVRQVEADDRAGADDFPDYSVLAPVIQVGNDKKNLLAEFPYGNGYIAILTDPYIISNGGVNLVDNAVLGVNLLSGGGTIAFDEFHQGYGSDQNRLLSYFNGTPVIPVFLQLCLLIGLLMLSKSRRFGRPLPMREPSRLSKLEYVAAMAQLKRRTKAFDLAIENIYTDFRRRISRLAGVENSRKRNRDFSAWIAKRTDYTSDEVFALIEKCEDIMHGEATNKKEVLALSIKIREIEKALGLRRGRNAFRK